MVRGALLGDYLLVNEQSQDKGPKAIASQIAILGEIAVIDSPS